MADTENQLELLADLIDQPSAKADAADAIVLTLLPFQFHAD